MRKNYPKRPQKRSSVISSRRSRCAFSLLLALATSAWGTDLIKAGDVYATGADAEGANACYNAAMIEEPQLSLELSFLLRRSRIGQELGEEELARAILVRAQSLAVSTGELGSTSWLLGLDAFFVHDYARARSFFSSALLYHPNPPVELLYYLGWSLYKTRDYNAARNVFLNLRDLAPGEFSPEELDILLAAVDLKAGLFETALKQLEKAPIYPVNTRYRDQALYMGGYAAFRMDSLLEARAFFERLEDTALRTLSLARLEMEEGNFSTAAELYGHMSNEEGVYCQAVALYLKGRAIEAERKARSYLFEYPEGGYAADSYLLLALIERGRGRNDKAIGELERGLEVSSPTRPLLLRTFADIEFARKRYRESLNAYRRLINEYPEYRENELLRLSGAKAFFYLGETDTAELELKNLLRVTRDEVIASEAHYYLGEAAARRGDYLGAADEFGAVLEGSLHAQALRRKGEVLAQAGLHREAIQAFQASLAEARQREEKEELLLLIEESRLALGVYPDRISMLKRFLELHPEALSAPQLRLQVALEYFERRNCVAALHELNKILDRYPESSVAVEAAQYKARCQRELGRIDEAIATYQDIPKRFPDSKAASRSQVELAELLVSLGRDSEALAVYRNLAASSRAIGERAAYTVAMAEIYHAQGNLQAAADLVSAALKESSDPAVSRRAFLLGIEVELARGDIKAARAYVSRYRGLFGETAEYLLKRAAIDRASGDLEDALWAYRNAASRLYPRSESRVSALINAAETAQLLGQNDEARRLLEEAALEVQLDRQRIEITRRLQSLE